MKKLLCALLSVVTLATTATAETIGLLSRLNISEAQFQERIPKEIEAEMCLFAPGFENISFRFYDSMIAMVMALDAGKIDSLDLPQCVGRYLLLSNPKNVLRGVRHMSIWMATSLGFRSEDSALRDRVDEALAEMEESGKLALLVQRYITGPEAGKLEPVVFERYDGAETIRVAVTGDLPPLDYVAPDGTPAGFNVAVLAELARRLNVNISIENIDSAARAASLASKRVDCVFWFEAPYDSSLPRFDLPEGIILSVPYYSWDTVYYIGKKK